MADRTLLTAAAVWAGDPPLPDADALVLDGDRIEWAGRRDELPGRAPKNAVDLGGAVVVPGFVDPHHHFSHALMHPGWVDLTHARSTAEVITRLRRGASATPPGRWIVGFGYREAFMGRGTRIGRADLDRVSIDRPVLMCHRSMHSGAANSAALAAVGFGRGTPRWPGGELERDLRGEPNGRAWERAFGVLEIAAKRVELEALGVGWAERARDYTRLLLSEGVVAIGETGATPQELTLLVKADLPIDIVALPVGRGGLFATPRDALAGPVTGEVMGRVTVGPVKLFADGAERGCMRIPYPVAGRMVRSRAGAGGGSSPLDELRLLRPRPAPGAIRIGLAHYEPDRLDAMAREAVRRGFGVAIHAIGNEGVRYAVDAIEAAGAEGARIEHAMFTDPREADRMAGLGITAVVQPAHLSEYGEVIHSMGVADALPPVPLRRFTDAGVAFALSSDAPTASAPPLRTMPVAVTRMTEGGNLLAADQALSPSEALGAQTLAGARVLGIEQAGAILPGYRADLAVLSGDPFADGTVVRETWLAGVRAYPAPETS